MPELEIRYDNRFAMHKAQLDVQQFHRALEIPVGNYSHPQLSRGQLRADLIMEEAVETAQAACGREIVWHYTDAITSGPHFVDAIDGLCDLIVVSYGAAVEWGVNLAPFWHEVHRSNMAKVGGPTRADGKKLKPEGWTPPDIARILGDMMPQEAR